MVEHKKKELLTRKASSNDVINYTPEEVKEMAKLPGYSLDEVRNKKPLENIP